MLRTKRDIVADIDPITDVHVLLTRLGAPKRSLEKDAEDALVLSMIQVGTRIAIIRNNRTFDNMARDVVAFEAGAYTETFEALVAMSWRCVEGLFGQTLAKDHGSAALRGACSDHTRCVYAQRRAVFAGGCRGQETMG